MHREPSPKQIDTGESLRGIIRRQRALAVVEQRAQRLVIVLKSVHDRAFLLSQAIGKGGSRASWLEVRDYYMSRHWRYGVSLITHYSSLIIALWLASFRAMSCMVIMPISFAWSPGSTITSCETPFFPILTSAVSRL